MQPIHWRGWFRLWLILSLIFVPVGATYLVNDLLNSWEKIDQFGIKVCVDGEDGKPEHDAMLCEKRLGIGKTAFEREHTTALAYWMESLGLAFLADLFLTGVIVALVLAMRWIMRGFRSPSQEL